jgi:hypothetical protein
MFIDAAPCSVHDAPGHGHANEVRRLSFGWEPTHRSSSKVSQRGVFFLAT